MTQQEHLLNAAIAARDLLQGIQIAIDGNSSEEPWFEIRCLNRAIDSNQGGDPIP